MVFEGQFQAAPMELRMSPPHEECQFIRGPLNAWPEDLKVTGVGASDADWAALVDVAPRRPLLFERGTDGRTVLVGAGRLLLLSDEGQGRGMRLESTGEGRINTSSVLDDWLRSAPNPAAPPGVCAATFVRL